MLNPAVNAYIARSRYVARMSDSLDRLHHAVLAARNADPAVSRTARLLNAGPSKIAKKFGEEAIEVVDRRSRRATVTTSCVKAPIFSTT